MIHSFLYKKKIKYRILNKFLIFTSLIFSITFSNTYICKAEESNKAKEERAAALKDYIDNSLKQKKAEEKKEKLENEINYFSEEKERLKDTLRQTNADLIDSIQVLSQIDEKIKNKEFLLEQLKNVDNNSSQSVQLDSYLSSNSNSNKKEKNDNNNSQEEAQKLEEELKELKELRVEQLKRKNKINSIMSYAIDNIIVKSDYLALAEIESEINLKELEEATANTQEQLKRYEEEKEFARMAYENKARWLKYENITITEYERKLLACIIYCEAGNQPYEGKVAVGAVVLNRLRSDRFPNTIEEIIYAPRQFAPVADGHLATRLRLDAPEECYRAADDALQGCSPIGDCLFFRTIIPGIDGQIIQDHIFY